MEASVEAAQHTMHAKHVERKSKGDCFSFPSPLGRDVEGGKQVFRLVFSGESNGANFLFALVYVFVLESYPAVACLALTLAGPFLFFQSYNEPSGVFTILLECC